MILYHQYYSLDFIMKMRIRQLIRLLIEALNKEKEQRAWDLYLAKYPYMNEDNFISFEDWYNPLINADDSTDRSVEDILAEVREILHGEEETNGDI